MKITFVKKIKANGQACSKCRDIEDRLIAEDQLSRIDKIVIADERDPESEGLQLAKLHHVDRAPFFLVEGDDGIRVYTVYFKFVKEVLGKALDSKDEAGEILNDHPDLDFI